MNEEQSTHLLQAYVEEVVKRIDERHNAQIKAHEDKHLLEQKAVELARGILEERQAGERNTREALKVVDNARIDTLEKALANAQGRLTGLTGAAAVISVLAVVLAVLQVFGGALNKP